jgi:prolyl-tRNA synthetase
MRFSQSFITTLREDPKVADCISHKFLLKGSYLYMVSSGIYAYMPLGLRVLRKLSDIIRKHMDKAGAQELLMSALQPMEIWQKTGRDKDLSEVMLNVDDRKGRKLCLGPTHEEEITEIVKRFISSYKQLPINLYQIQSKFRDEPRARFGLMRSCEFVMKDAYSFDFDQKGLDESYDKMLAAYKAIFTECGLDFVMSEADSGFMGGSVSHEFMVPAEIGEDILTFCPTCDDYIKQDGFCPDCKTTLENKKMIEVGHIFKLGTKYSVAQEALFLDKDGKRKPVIMGCYGIGVSRLIPAIVEQSHDEKGIIWPKTVAPFDATIVVLDEALINDALKLEEELAKQGRSVLIDDRNDAAGVKFNDAALLGNPYIVVMGKNYAKTKKFDLEIRETKEKKNFSQKELLKFFKDEYSR